MADITIRLEVGDVRPALDEIVGGARNLLMTIIRVEAIGALQAPGSDWPVQTGLSKASFDGDIYLDRVEITNATSYAEHVEERTGAALATLTDYFAGASLDAAVERQLQPYLDSQ